MALLTMDTILLLDSFGNLYETVNTGEQVLIPSDRLALLIPVLERNGLGHEAFPYEGLAITMLILYK